MAAIKCTWCRKPATTRVVIRHAKDKRSIFDGPLCEGHTDREKATAGLNIHTAEFLPLDSVK